MTSTDTDANAFASRSTLFKVNPFPAHALTVSLNDPVNEIPKETCGEAADEAAAAADEEAAPVDEAAARKHTEEDEAAAFAKAAEEAIALERAQAVDGEAVVGEAVDGEAEAAGLTATASISRSDPEDAPTWQLDAEQWLIGRRRSRWG